MITTFQSHISKIVTTGILALIILSVSLFAFAPTIASAVEEGNFIEIGSGNNNSNNSGDLGQISTTFEKIINFINNTLIPLVFAIALLVFLYGVFKYFILGGGDESSRADGRQLMLYAIIGFVVMVSIFGIVNIVVRGFGLDGDSTIDVPNVPRQDR